MTKVAGKIVFRWPAKHRDKTDLQGESVHVSPVSRWISYLILIPASLAAVALAAFFFSVLLALFLVAGIFLGAWVWWLRRKMRKSVLQEDLEGECVVINDTRIVKTKADKEGEQ